MSKTPKPEKTQARTADEQAKDESGELSGEELEAVAGGTLTLSNLQAGSLSTLKKVQMAPTVGLDATLPTSGGNLL